MAFPSQNHIDAADASAEYWYSQFGVYSFPSFRLAQTAIESAEGKALSGTNNYWGVKANKDQIAARKFKVCRTHEVIKGKTVEILDKFASYDSLEDGYIQQAKLLVTSPYYEKSRHDTNPKQYAIDVAVHYATSPSYAKVVIAYMDAHNLYQFDHMDHHPGANGFEPGKLKPPAHLEKKAQAPATTGAIVIAGATVTAASSHGGFSAHPGIIAAGIVVALVCAGVALLKYRQAHKVLGNILTPPTEAEKAEVLAQVAAAKVSAPLGEQPTPDATTPVAETATHP